MPLHDDITCATCAFFKPMTEATKDEPASGQCRANAPVIIVMPGYGPQAPFPLATWPSVSSIGGCGIYEWDETLEEGGGTPKAAPETDPTVIQLRRLPTKGNA